MILNWSFIDMFFVVNIGSSRIVGRYGHVRRVVMGHNIHGVVGTCLMIRMIWVVLWGIVRPGMLLYLHVELLAILGTLRMHRKVSRVWFMAESSPFMPLKFVFLSEKLMMGLTSLVGVMHNDFLVRWWNHRKTSGKLASLVVVIHGHAMMLLRGVTKELIFIIEATNPVGIGMAYSVHHGALNVEILAGSNSC